MKLPQFINTAYHSRYNGACTYPATPPGIHTIHTQADEEDAGDIFACVRGVQGNDDDEGSCGPCHCYLKLVKDGRIVSSRGYFVQGPAPEWKTTGSCTVVKKKASAADWKAATDTYDRRKAEDYGLATNNCCTAAVEGANAVPGGGAPVKLYTANAGVGTVCVLQ